MTTPAEQPAAQTPAGELLMCGNEDHPRPTKAVAKVSWPNSTYKPTTACAGDLAFLIWQARQDGTPILIEPIGSRP